MHDKPVVPLLLAISLILCAARLAGRGGAGGSGSPASSASCSSAWRSVPRC